MIHCRYFFLMYFLFFLASPSVIADPFFLSGNLADLIPADQKRGCDVGLVTILTEPIHQNSSQAIQGHAGVTRSVMRGLKKLGYPHNYNPRTIGEVGDHIVVLVNIDALRQAIELKKQGRIKTVIVGPNILGNPSEYNHILGSPEIDWYIAPCNWARDCNIQEEPLIAGKTAIWYAGVDTEDWKPHDNKQSTKRMLIYWKTESEHFCTQVEQLVKKYGWDSVRIHYGDYLHDHYKQSLQEVDAAVFISVSESQGIALAECWSMDVPTLVWNPETAFIYNRWLPVSSAPYLSPKTGFFWKTVQDLEKILNDYNTIDNDLSPRSWVCEHMTDESSISILLNLIQYSL